MTSKPRIVIAGAGGHARVVADLIETGKRYALEGAVDPKAREARGMKLLGGDEQLPGLKKRGVKLAAVGVGGYSDTKARRGVFERLEGLGFRLPALVHPAATLARTAELGDGCQVMAGAVVNAFARLGRNTLVNTGSVVEHDCVLSDHAFVGPGCRIGGGAILGEGAFVGIGATVLPRVRIGARAVVGAGAVVLKDVPEGAVVAGVPAREIKR